MNSSSNMNDHEVTDAEKQSPPVSEEEIRLQLDHMGIDVLDPESRKEETMALALDDFSSFVLKEERETCHTIIEDHLDKTVGELQGGSPEYEIYRISITDDENEAAGLLIKEFHASRQGKKHKSILTVEKLQQYMLGMCERRSQNRNSKQKYKELGNLMFILTFGTTQGQVRHIDHMDPNLQICLYMSRRCPSTIVYSMDGPELSSANDLVEYWEEQNHAMPDLVKTILQSHCDTALKAKFHTKYFGFWNTINAMLESFGKLYRPVEQKLSLETDPGTTLIVGGNEVHAGPPTTEARMFAFAIGIPDADETDEENNGEIQYNPALFHLDLCCILFSMMDFEYADRQEEHAEAKRFLLHFLICFVKEFPKESYVRLIGDDRSEFRLWIGNLVASISDEAKVKVILQEAIESESLLYTPDVCKRRAKKKKRRN